MDNKQKLFNDIWKVADELRGKVDGWDFKNYVLGFLFYKFISENIRNYINETEYSSGNKDFDYLKIDDNRITEDIKNDIINSKGFFIYPSQLFSNVYLEFKNNNSNINNLNEILLNIFNQIEATTINTKSEDNFKGIFTFININNQLLGDSLIERNKHIFKVMQMINENFNFDNQFDQNSNEIFGDSYEYLMQMYASNAGKSGGGILYPATSK